MWFFWGYTRLFCFPFLIYTNFMLTPFTPPLNMSGTYEGYNYHLISSLLTILFLMGIWWWYLISKMVFDAVTKGKNKDI